MAGYIGNAPINNSIYKQIFTPATGVTTFTTGTAYTPGFIDVYQNGIKLIDTTDYTASNGTTVDLIVAATTGDTVEIIVYETFQSAAPSAYTGNFSVSGTGTVSGAFRHGVLVKSANYTVLSTDPNVCLVTTAGGHRTMTLPAASAVAGQIIRFVKVDTGAGRLIIARAAGGSDTMGINANTTMELWFQDNYVDLMSDGTSRWIVVSTEMFIIPDDRRYDGGNGWIPSAGNSATFVALDYSAALPVGTRVAKVFALIQQGAVGEAILYVRRTGSSIDTTGNGDAQIRTGSIRANTADIVRETSIFDTEVNADLEFDYKVSTGTDGDIFMNARGYRLG